MLPFHFVFRWTAGKNKYLGSGIVTINIVRNLYSIDAERIKLDGFRFS